jgi:hypothetical protein
MKKQINPTIKAHLIRGAFYLILLVAVCAIPFALARRSTDQTATAKIQRNSAAHGHQFTNAYGRAPVVFKKSPFAQSLLKAPLGTTCPATITESSSQALTAGNSVACNDNTTGFTVENHYWRAFNMTTFTGGQAYNITSVSFGIEQATSGSGTGQPVTVNLYTNSGAPFPGGTRTLLATSGSINIPDQALTIFNQPITATVPAGTLELVMEVTNPDGVAAMNMFFIGSNASPETAPSYLSAADCGITDPTTTSDIGFPNMHIVFNVNGSCPSGGSPTPTPSGSPSCTPGYTTATSTGTITAGGTDIGNHCDDCTTDITLPFPVSVYGTATSVASVGSDGDIHFTGPYNKLFWWTGCVPVDPMGGQDPFVNTLFPNYADLVTDESVGACPDCGIFTQTLGTAPNRQFVIRWKANYFNSPPGPAQAEFEVLLTEGSNTLSVIYGVTGDNGLTAVSGIQQDLKVFTSFSCDEATLTAGLRVDYIPTSCGSPTPTPTATATTTATATATPTATATASASTTPRQTPSPRPRPTPPPRP